MKGEIIKAERESQFELLRLVAQYMIVFYHLLLICVVPFNSNIWLEALEIPPHIGVVLFVLISGYFGIRPSSKGLLKLLTVLLVYSLPGICHHIVTGDSLRAICRSLFFFSHTDFWFIRTYVFLYLLSPMVNRFLREATARERWYMLAALFFVASYIATAGGDWDMADGKNVVNFILIYCVGDTLRLYKDRLSRINVWWIVAVYVLLNAALVVGYAADGGSVLSKVIWRLCFPHSSPVLLVSAVLFFLIFSKMKFHSRAVNWVAKSAFAVYLLHLNYPWIMGWSFRVGDYPVGLIGKVMSRVIDFAPGDGTLVLLLLPLTLAILVLCIGIDKILTPLWRFCNAQYDKLYRRLGF